MEKNKGRKNILKSSLAVLLIIAGLVSLQDAQKKQAIIKAIPVKQNLLRFLMYPMTLP